MKKILAAAMLALAIPCVAMAAKPVNSQKLLDDPGRFAVVYVSDDERVYAGYGYGGEGSGFCRGSADYPRQALC